MKTRQLIYLTAITVVLTAQSAYAYPFGEGRGPSGEKMEAHHEEMVRDLGLTEDQQKRMEEYKEKHHAKMKELRKTLKGYHQELKEELGKYDSNSAEVERISSNIKDIHSRLVDHRVETIQTMKTILTPEQFEKFHLKAEKMKEELKKQWKHKKDGNGKGATYIDPEPK